MVVKTKGKLIVLEGIDGSGKETQFKKLIKKLKSKKIQAKTLDFPRYKKQSAYFVKKYLKGKYGSLTDVNPYCASLFYALDRFDAKEQIEIGLEQGEVLIANRYTPSNMGHQGAKISNKKERLAFFQWLYQMEYKTLEIPKPTKTIFLHVPAPIAWYLIKKREGKKIIKKQDIHEVNFSHLKKAETAYLQMIETFPEDFVVVECVEDGQLLAPNKIHQKIWQLTDRILKS